MSELRNGVHERPYLAFMRSMILRAAIDISTDFAGKNPPVTDREKTVKEWEAKRRHIALNAATARRWVFDASWHFSSFLYCCEMTGTNAAKIKKTILTDPTSMVRAFADESKEAKRSRARRKKAKEMIDD